MRALPRSSSQVPWRYRSLRLSAINRYFAARLSICARVGAIGSGERGRGVACGLFFVCPYSSTVMPCCVLQPSPIPFVSTPYNPGVWLVLPNGTRACDCDSFRHLPHSFQLTLALHVDGNGRAASRVRSFEFSRVHRLSRSTIL